MRPVIYLGPSLPLAEAKDILDADYRPPVKRGDLQRLEGVELVGIIDGVFLQSCSVGHREILSLLNRKVKVVGGGSMGALRAAEMGHYGMIGVGQIFKMYASEEVQGDDEVALVFDPETMEPLSEPLVNLRVLLDAAWMADVIDTAQRAGILSEMRSIYYPRRTVPAFLEVARRRLGKSHFEEFDRFFADNYRDIKKEDAITVLKFIKDACEQPYKLL
ncbi:MAG TPA: TfuA-related McrA-glycine thioamidation protein [Methanomassiliicoccales archaeon]|nr:TfuA-related McrA-glycine thioamidation protein [Methanomassiliicoccales archaeon]